MFNQFNLSSDLMEPFRILVDRVVKLNDFNVFEKDQRILLIDILNDTVIIDGKEQFVNNAIKIYCHSIFEAIEDNDLSLIKFYNYEL